MVLGRFGVHNVPELAVLLFVGPSSTQLIVAGPQRGAVTCRVFLNPFIQKPPGNFNVTEDPCVIQDKFLS